MRRYGTLLLVLVLATASLLAAAAYNTATVANAGSITVSNTSTALLALNPLGGVGNKDLTAEIQSGNLVFAFGRGNNPFFGGDKLYGLQKNSTYVWGQDVAAGTNLSGLTQGMFNIKNMSAETIKTSIQVTGIPAGVKVYFAGCAGYMNSWVDMGDGLAHEVMPWGWGSVGSGNTVNVAVKITVDGTATFPLTSTLSIIVSAVAVP